MCLMLYIGCDRDIPLRKGKFLSVEELDSKEFQVAQWFDTKHVYFIGSHSGCSYGFPHVIAEGPINYFDGMFDGTERSEDDLNSIIELLKLLKTLITDKSVVKLYPIWDGDQGMEPKGTITLEMIGQNPNHFFFNERFMHIVSAEPQGLILGDPCRTKVTT
jgi:hypothetical protein